VKKVGRTNGYSMMISTIFFLSMSSCNKEMAAPQVGPPLVNKDTCYRWVDTTLPPITHDGLNTVGCMINGKPWVPKVGKINGNENFYTKSIDFYYVTNPKYANPPRFRFWAVKNFQNPCDTAFSLLGFANVKVYEGGTYLINNDYPLNSHYGESIGGDHSLIRDGKSYLTIDYLDTVKHIISGRFGMNVLDYKYDTVKITDGRFDVIYNPEHW